MAGTDRPVVNKSPQEAQNLKDFNRLSGSEPLYEYHGGGKSFIGHEPRKAGFIDWKTMNTRPGTSPEPRYKGGSNAEAGRLLAGHPADDCYRKSCQYEVPRPDFGRADLFLDDDEVEKLFVLMQKLKGERRRYRFVTSFPGTGIQVCDRITVLENGTLVGEYKVSRAPAASACGKMMGKNFDDLADIKGAHTRGGFERCPVIDAEGLSHAGTIKPSISGPGGRES